MLFFAHNGIRAPFSGDDLMNLHGHLARGPANLIADCIRYWSTSYRPLGGLFYTLLYRVFGFHPLPFRLACFGLLAINLALLGRFAFRLTESWRIAGFVLLLAGYNAWLVDLYYSTGTVYDLLAYCFFFLAFNFYLGIREDGRAIGWRRTLLLCALYICALDAKEAAVTLPVLLCAYELIYHWRDLRSASVRWAWREGRVVAATALLTIPYILVKTQGAGSLTENPAYRLSISPGHYLDSFHFYLNVMLYQRIFRDPNTVQLVAAMLVVALLLRSRPMLFAWCFLIVALLPVAFIAHNSGFFIYFPMAGWALYGATLMVRISDAIVHAFVRLFRMEEAGAKRMKFAAAAALAIGVAAFLTPYHKRQSVKTLSIFNSVEPPTTELAAQMIALRPRLPHGARVLFLGEPVPPQNEYFPLFLARLVYDDLDIAVDRQSGGSESRYDAVFAFRDGRLVDGGG